mgnify:CR=1 FL=1
MVSLPSDSIPLSLFNLRKDIGERKNIADEHPELVEELKQMGLDFQEDVLANQRGVEWITH